LARHAYVLIAASLIALFACSDRTPTPELDITGTWDCHFDVPGVVQETATMTFAADGTVSAQGATRIQTAEGEMTVVARRTANWRLEGSELIQTDAGQQILEVSVAGSILPRDAP
jgi:hypothetical protein